jgi:hypothetical protein
LFQKLSTDWSTDYFSDKLLACIKRGKITMDILVQIGLVVVILFVVAGVYTIIIRILDNLIGPALGCLGFLVVVAVTSLISAGVGALVGRVVDVLLFDIGINTEIGTIVGAGIGAVIGLIIGVDIATRKEPPRKGIEL